ncbi:MAG: class I SAM-dependent methyltransferase, partial [Alphaproteobacteria bacterium]
MNDTAAPETDFGYRKIPKAEKAGMVRAVFESVAPKYDVMNDLMSLGVHRVWKRIFVNAIGAGPHDALLDLAGGTGDISFLALERGAGRVILTDVNPAMLEVAQGRALSRGLQAVLEGERIAWAEARRDGMRFPFPPQ